MLPIKTNLPAELKTKNNKWGATSNQSRMHRLMVWRTRTIAAVPHSHQYPNVSRNSFKRVRMLAQKEKILRRTFLLHAKYVIWRVLPFSQHKLIYHDRSASFVVNSVSSLQQRCLTGERRVVGMNSGVKARLKAAKNFIFMSY